MKKKDELSENSILYEVDPISDTSSFRVGLDKNYSFHSTFRSPDSFGQNDLYSTFVENFIKRKEYLRDTPPKYPISDSQIDTAWNPVQKILYCLQIPPMLISHPIVEKVCSEILTNFNKLSKKATSPKSLTSTVNHLIHAEENAFSISFGLHKFISYELIKTEKNKNALEKSQLLVTMIDSSTSRKYSPTLIKKIYYDMDGHIIDFDFTSGQIERE